MRVRSAQVRALPIIAGPRRRSQAWLVGQRTTEDGLAFMYDLKDRMKERIQLSTDGHQAYRGSVLYAF
ncbi:MAG TPA: hypothetical protein VFW38_05690, partial [Solirubrobacteraceae bacterium]|nr:hypothetical protein [Solirubrobacteraceae bacterium]